MKAIAVIPGKPDTVHLREVPKPRLNGMDNGRGVLVKVLRVGVAAAREYQGQPEAQDEEPQESDPRPTDQ